MFSANCPRVDRSSHEPRALAGPGLRLCEFLAQVLRRHDEPSGERGCGPRQLEGAAAAPLVEEAAEQGGEDRGDAPEGAAAAVGEAQVPLGAVGRNDDRGGGLDVALAADEDQEDHGLDGEDPEHGHEDHSDGHEAAAKEQRLVLAEAPDDRAEDEALHEDRGDAAEHEQDAQGAGAEAEHVLQEGRVHGVHDELGHRDEEPREPDARQPNVHCLPVRLTPLSLRTAVRLPGEADRAPPVARQRLLQPHPSKEGTRKTDQRRDVEHHATGDKLVMQKHRRGARTDDPSRCKDSSQRAHVVAPVVLLYNVKEVRLTDWPRAARDAGQQPSDQELIERAHEGRRGTTDRCPNE
mmetsp:Transcript_56146/g.180191  ORF Transcript_56146/g.180191 Transcript_56146/m.180191 type:complete len:351 (+) Transcript_56146:186-1238(+)